MIHDSSVIAKYWTRWNNVKDFDYDRYQKAFRYIYQITSITKYRDFQYRLLLKKIPCNQELFTWGKVHTKNCTFNCDEIEDELHLFVKCPHVTPLWDWFIETLKIDLPIYNLDNIVMNECGSPPKHCTNLIMIMTKQFIYHCKCEGKIPHIKRFLQELNYFIQLK